LGGGFQLAAFVVVVVVVDVDDDDDDGGAAAGEGGEEEGEEEEEEDGGGANMRANILARSRRLDVTTTPWPLPPPSYELARVHRKGTIPFTTTAEPDEEAAAAVVTWGGSRGLPNDVGDDWDRSSPTSLLLSTLSFRASRCGGGFLDEGLVASARPWEDEDDDCTASSLFDDVVVDSVAPTATRRRRRRGYESTYFHTSHETTKKPTSVLQ